MIRLAWRQFRMQAAVAAVALVAFAILLAVSPRPHVVHPQVSTSVTPQGTGTAVSIRNPLLSSEHLGLVLLAIPALIGVFWGAPLAARELESGTFRLAWTQSVSRTRWLAVKLGLAGLASAACAGAFSLLVTWWFGKTDAVINPGVFSIFDVRDIAPVGYALFAFALGVTAGVLIRRTLPAMAVTLFAFVAVRLAFEQGVRPGLMTPLRVAAPFKLKDGPGSSGIVDSHAWIVSDTTINAAGKVIGHNGGLAGDGVVGFARAAHGGIVVKGVGTCPGITANGTPPGVRELQACIDRFGIREVLTYQPAGRYWTLQVYETAIFVALALALAGFCCWWVARPNLRLRGALGGRVRRASPAA